jgi:tRNA(fMet)-specific endonuclease VapC
MARLIDTTVLIDMERKGRGLGVLRDLLAGEIIAMSSGSAAELLLGIERADSPDRRLRREEFVAALLEEIPVLSFDVNVARIHARVGAFLLDAGRPMAQHDLMIAATAIAHGYAMLTHNLRHFGRVPGLAVEAPKWPDE